MVLFSCLFFLTGNLFAQWTSRTLPNGGTINKVLPYDGTTAFIVGANNAIYRTTNGGSTWDAVTVNVTSGNTYNIMDIAFFDADNGFAVTAAGKDASNVTINGIVLVTTDKGLTWNPLAMTGFSDGSSSDATDPNLGTSLAINSIHCSTNAIYASLKWTATTKVSHSYLYKSTNLGVNWAPVSSDMSAVSINSVVSNADTLYIGGSSGTFKVSFDGGANWTDYSNSTAYTSVNDLRFISSDSVFLATTKGVFLTPDYGASTTQLSTVGSFDIVNIDGVDLLYTCGSSANNMRSVDAGTSWQVANIDLLSKSLFDLTLFGDSIYGCSTTGLLFSIQKDQIKDPVADFTSVVNGATVSFNNASQNCGTFSWSFGDAAGTSTEKNPTYTYGSYGTFTVQITASNAVSQSVISHDVVVSEPVVDFTYTVEDGNNVTFTNVSQNCQSYSWEMGNVATLTDESPAFAFPLLGTYTVKLTAFNGLEEKSVTKEIAIDSVGIGWTYTLCGNQNLQKLWAIDDLNAVVVGNGTAIFRTTDGGIIWETGSYSNTIGSHVVNDLIFMDDNLGFASYTANGTINGFILKTTDKGANWGALDLALFSDNSGDASKDPVAGQKVSFYSMAKLSSTVAMVAVRWQDVDSKYHGYVYKTSDAGTTWAKTSTDIFQDYAYTGVITALVFDANAQTGYLAGNKLLLVTANGGETWTDISKTDYGYINDIIVKDANNVFLATGVGVIKTTDGFANFTKVTTDYAFDIVEVAENTYLAGKDATTLKITRDSGTTWEAAGNGLTSSFFELALFNGKVYGLGAAGKMHLIYIDFYQTPVPAFNATADGKAVTFENTSVNASSYTWSFGDDATSTEESPVHTYSNYGTYTVKLEAMNRCHVIELTKDVAVTNTGVGDLTQNGLRVWPNPVINGDINIILDNNADVIESISVIDVQGRILYEGNINSGNTSLHVDLDSGLYIVRVETTGKKVILRKIMVQ